MVGVGRVLGVLEVMGYCGSRGDHRGCWWEGHTGDPPTWGCTARGSRVCWSTAVVGAVDMEGLRAAPETT